jgi:hypothetical protein
MEDLEGRKAGPEDWGKAPPDGHHWEARGLDWYLVKDGKRLDPKKLPPLSGPMGQAGPHEYKPRFEIASPARKGKGLIGSFLQARRRGSGLLIALLGIVYLVNGQGWELAIALGLIAVGLLMLFG